MHDRSRSHMPRSSAACRPRARGGKIADSDGGDGRFRCKHRRTLQLRLVARNHLGLCFQRAPASGLLVEHLAQRWQRRTIQA